MGDLGEWRTTSRQRVIGTALSAFAGAVGGHLLAGFGGAFILGAALALMNLAAMLWPKLMVALAMATFSALVGYIAGGTPLAVILGSISFISFYLRIARSLVLDLVQIFF